MNSSLLKALEEQTRMSLVFLFCFSIRNQNLLIILYLLILSGGSVYAGMDFCATLKSCPSNYVILRCCCLQTNIRQSESISISKSVLPHLESQMRLLLLNNIDTFPFYLLPQCFEDKCSCLMNR